MCLEYLMFGNASAGLLFQGDSRPTQRAPDWWDSARFQAVCVA
jgi:hypothetical protein